MQNTNFKVGGRQPITLDRLVRGIIAILLIVGVGLSIYYLSSVLIPFFVAWVVAYLLYPMVRFCKIAADCATGCWLSSLRSLLRAGY